MKSRCRLCASDRLKTVFSLGTTPLANAYLTEEQLLEPEVFFPLELKLCRDCLLAQLDEYEHPDAIFTDYAYFASCSTTWLDHARAYVEAMTERFALGPRSQVVEIASNDGYLLQYFVERGIPVLGIEPAANVAEEAVRRSIPTLVEFWHSACAERLAQEGRFADLIIGNNVLAHVPGLNDFVAGLKILLKPHGIITMEFPHLYRLVEGNQFDTIYHEHFSYYSFFVVQHLFGMHGLTLFDVDELPTHGGSLRIYARHTEDDTHPIEHRVEALLKKEQEAGMRTIDYYEGFGERAGACKRELLAFLLDAKQHGKRIVGYGAAAKGNTLLNFCGIGRDFVDFIVDRNPHKQDLYTPGTRIPIRDPQAVDESRPDYLLILPWNITDEIVDQMQRIRSWGGRFVTPIPHLRVIE